MIELLCIGNAMVDVFAEVPPDFCKQFALKNPVQHVSSETAAAILAALPNDVVITAGGGAANTAKIATRLGLSAAFTGAVGSDNYADLFENELKETGVFVHIVRKKSPTGVFISLTAKNSLQEDTEFSGCIAASPSAALEFTAEDIDLSLFESAENTVRVLMLEGFLLGRDTLVSRIGELVTKHKIPLAVDFGTSLIASVQAELFKEKHSPLWDKTGKFPLILFFNEKEAEAFAKIFGYDWESLFIFLSHSILTAVKLAERGAAVFSGGKVYYTRAKRIKAAESTGAGDAFAAGFLAAWIRGEGPEQCGQAGNAAASLVLKAQDS